MGKMERDTEMVIEEAVIGCQFRPIYTLIKSPYLQECLKCCTDKYTEDGCKEGGPYLITFGNDLDEPRYLTVDHQNSNNLTTTSQLQDAEAFMVKVLGDSASHHKFEFSLTSSFPRYRKRLEERRKAPREQQWQAGEEQQQHSPVARDEQQEQDQGEQEDQQQQGGQESHDGKSSAGFSVSTQLKDKQKESTKKNVILPLEYYLETVVNMKGNGSITPRMRMTSKTKNVRLLLKKRIDHKIACDTRQWRKGRDAYYIQCIHPFHNGYLCAKKRHNQDTYMYQVCVKSSVDSHSDEGKVFMIFRLKPLSRHCFRIIT